MTALSHNRSKEEHLRISVQLSACICGKKSGRAGKALEGIKFFPVPNPCPVKAGLEEFDRLFIGLRVHREGVSVFAAMGKAEPGGVFKARRGLVNDLRNKGKG